MLELAIVLPAARLQPTLQRDELALPEILAADLGEAVSPVGGISETTARQHLSALYRRTGCLNVAQAADLLGRDDRDRAIGVLSVKAGP